MGDYVEMTPSYVGSYTPTINSSSPYYTGTDTPGSVTPSELTKWVVIKNDETNIEMISLNVSSTKITFYGQVGYKNYVGALNEIAKQYRNDAFTNGSRHIGYLSGSSIEQCSNLCAGDTYYENDISLVQTALNSDLHAITPNGDYSVYWLSNRSKIDYGNIEYGSGVVTYGVGYSTWMYILLGGDGSNASSEGRSNSVRPILSLKPNAIASPTGDGTEDNPWVLVEQ